MSKKRTGRLQEHTAVFSCGAAGYSLLELLWRGYTHWTMTVTGGICFLILYRINNKWEHKSIIKKCAAGSLGITLVEFLVGCIVNLGFKQQVWDYSERPFNLFGQICILYSFLWFLLCFPLCFLSKLIKKQFFSHVL